MKKSLIIWNEAPMAYKYYLEGLDKSLKDSLTMKSQDNRMKPFRGITIALRGDFSLILLVIQEKQESK